MKVRKRIAAMAAAAMFAMCNMFLTAEAVMSDPHKTSGGTNGYISVRTIIDKSPIQTTPGIYIYLYSARAQIVNNVSPYNYIAGITAKISIKGGFHNSTNSLPLSYNTDFSKSVNYAESSYSSSSSTVFTYATTTTEVDDPAFGCCQYTFNGSF